MDCTTKNTHRQLGKNYALQIGSRKDTDSAGRHFGQTIPYGGAGFN